MPEWREFFVGATEEFNPSWTETFAALNNRCAGSSVEASGRAFAHELQHSFDPNYQAFEAAKAGKMFSLPERVHPSQFLAHLP